MKTNVLILLLLCPFLVRGQNGGIRILPEAGVSLPIGDFEDVNVFAKQGIQFGFNIDKMWGKIGIGLYGGIVKNDINYNDHLPLNTGVLILSKSSAGSQFDWKHFRVGIGPIIKLDLSTKFDLELSSKLGFSKFSYPDYKESIQVEDPLNKEYTLYQTKNEEVKKKLNPIAMSALRLNFKATDKLNISLAANYEHAQGVIHSYTYLDAGFNPKMTNDELIQSLRTAPTVEEVRKCHFNSFGVTLGVGFILGGGKNIPKEHGKMDPPIPDYPKDGETLTIQEADSLTLLWIKETPNVNTADYNLWLYKIIESKQKPDSLIFKSKIKRAHQFTLPDPVKLTAGNYKWKVQAVGSSKLKPCPDGCFSVEEIFSISPILTDQYHELLSQNNGNYIEVTNQLRTCLHPCGRAYPIHCGGGRIFNQDNEVVLSIADLQRGQNNEQYTSDEKGRITFNLAQFPEGYYLFEQTYERNKKYYLRFKIIRGHEDINK